MKMTFCDFCGKEVSSYGADVTITVETNVSCVGIPDEEQYHFHRECYTRLKNKVTQFIAEKREEIDNEC